MIDSEMLAAILKELGYFDEDGRPTDKTESESGEMNKRMNTKKTKLYIEEQLKELVT